MLPADLGTLPMLILPILLTNFSHPVALRHAKFLRSTLLPFNVLVPFDILVPRVSDIL